MAEIDAILAHIEHIRSDITNLCAAVASLEKEVADMKLMHVNTYIPKAACVDIQKKCNAKMNSAVTKEEFKPVKAITYGVVTIIVIQVFRTLLNHSNI